MLSVRCKHRRGSLDLDLEVQTPAGQVLALMGPTGSGKTSLLRFIAGLEGPVGPGEWVHLADHALGHLPAWQRPVAMAPQRPPRLAHLPVRLQLRLAARGSASLDALPAELGLAPLLDRPPARLSGGELHRLSLARALLRGAPVLLLDEPLAAQDAARRPLLARSLRRWVVAHGLCCLWTTHDPEEAMQVADRVAVVEAGTLRRSGTVTEVWRDPGDWATARLLGYGPAVPDPRRQGAWMAIHPRRAQLLAKGATPSGAVCLPCQVQARREGPLGPMADVHLPTGPDLTVPVGEPPPSGASGEATLAVWDPPPLAGPPEEAVGP